MEFIQAKYKQRESEMEIKREQKDRGNLEPRLYDHNDMVHWKKYVYYSLTLFRNAVINKIPSRYFRRIYDKLMGVKFGEENFWFRRMEVLFPKGFLIGGGYGWLVYIA